MVKRCTRCGQEKELDEFHRAKRLKFGRTIYCKQCVYEYQYQNPERYQKHVERVRAFRAARWKPREYCASFPADERAWTPEIASYLAGFVDAEGTFVLSTVGNNVRTIFSVYNNDRDLLVYLQKFIGGSCREVKRKVRSAAHQISFVLELTNQQNIRAMCEHLVGSLIQKKSRCELMLETLNTTAALRLPLIERMRELNRKGVHISPYEKHDGLKLNYRNVDLAYLAGLVDGDGWIGSGVLGVSSTKPESLEYLFSVFGGRLAFVQRKAVWATSGSLVWTGEDAAWLVQQMRPYLQSERYDLRGLKGALA